MKDGPYDNRQLRGAWRAGYKAGFRDGQDGAAREGWVRPKRGTDLQPGDVIKLTVRSTFGWKGLARVVWATDNGVHAQKLDDGDEMIGTIDCCLHECMVRRPLTADIEQS